MAKRKASKSSDQSELPLGDTPPASSQGKKPAGQSKKPAGKAQKSDTKRKKAGVGGEKVGGGDSGVTDDTSPVTGPGAKSASKFAPPEIASQTTGAGGDAPASQPKGTDIVTVSTNPEPPPPPV